MDTSPQPGSQRIDWEKTEDTLIVDKSWEELALIEKHAEHEGFESLPKLAELDPARTYKLVRACIRSAAQFGKYKNILVDDSVINFSDDKNSRLDSSKAALTSPRACQMTQMSLILPYAPTLPRRISSYSEQAPKIVW